MTKAVLSNRIYLRASHELMKELSGILTYKLEVVRSKSGQYNTVETVRNYSIPKEGIIAIPSGRMDLIPEDYEVVDNRVNEDVEFPLPKIDLRDSQQDVWDAWQGSGILNALVGWGKSFTALWLAFKLGKKTLIVTHNTMLRDQWMKDIEAMFGIIPSTIGSGEFCTDGPVVIGNVQTVTKHSNELGSMFGTVIVDECHHTPALTFSNILANSKAKYKIGLTGTMERKDKRHIMFKDYFGPYVAKPPQSHTLNPKVKIVQAGVKLLQGASYPQKINHLMQDEEYIHFIAGLARVQAAKGHKVLIIGDRVNFIHSVATLLPDCIPITGKMASFEDREKAKELIQTPEYNIIAGTRPIFAEGISINCLSCIILTCPIAGEALLEQLIGRIMRIYPGKLPPEVLDINFKGATEKSQNNLRLAFYLVKGWEVDKV